VIGHSSCLFGSRTHLSVVGSGTGFAYFISLESDLLRCLVFGYIVRYLIDFERVATRHLL
jgi:hypothetical protein